jgi:hypothetical protein
MVYNVGHPVTMTELFGHADRTGQKRGRRGAYSKNKKRAIVRTGRGSPSRLRLGRGVRRHLLRPTQNGLCPSCAPQFGRDKCEIGRMFICRVFSDFPFRLSPRIAKSTPAQTMANGKGDFAVDVRMVEPRRHIDKPGETVVQNDDIFRYARGACRCAWRPGKPGHRFLYCRRL